MRVARDLPRRVPAPEARATLRFSLFHGDGFNGVLGRLGLGGDGALRLAARVVFVVLFAWGPMALAAWLRGDLVAAVPREAFLLDLAQWAQFFGFVPLAMVAEVFIDRRMRGAVPRLRPLADPGAINRAAVRASRLSRWWIADFACVAFGCLFSWLWAIDERFNGIPSWHTAVEAGRESFTWAGVWAAFVALPLFTYMWLRWVWKIGVWTALLHRLSRLDLRLMAVHPDRTAGLGSLSEVQTSFALILFGTGILFSMAMSYKVLFEGTPVTSYTVWAPVVGYVVLAPAVFLAPLFLFTGALGRAKQAALRRFDRTAAVLARRFEDRWLVDPEGPGRELFSSNAPSALADFQIAFNTVQSMRVVPFDLRSLIELFSAATAPFAPLVFLAELPDRLRPFYELIRPWL